jgi:hypothetical protein
MEDTSGKYNMKGRRKGSAPAAKAIKHVLKHDANGVKFEVYAFVKLTPAQVAQEVKKFLGDRRMDDLSPWRTYRIDVEQAEE